MHGAFSSATGHQSLQSSSLVWFPALCMICNGAKAAAANTLTAIYVTTGNKDIPPFISTAMRAIRISCAFRGATKQWLVASLSQTWGAQPWLSPLLYCCEASTRGMCRSCAWHASSLFTRASLLRIPGKSCHRGLHSSCIWHPWIWSMFVVRHAPCVGELTSFLLRQLNVYTV